MGKKLKCEEKPKYTKRKEVRLYFINKEEHEKAKKYAESKGLSITSLCRHLVYEKLKELKAF